MNVWVTSMVFAAGHRLRVHVTSSSFPGFSTNPNTGPADPQDAPPRVAHNTVHLGGQSASYILLPVRQ
jgi:predicted acyl esterase